MAEHEVPPSPTPVAALPVHMTASEQECVSNFFKPAKSYVEFGCGGSTVLASKLIAGTIIAIDSSKEWVERVRAECKRTPDQIQPTLLHVDIGSTGDWGRPIDESAIGRWPQYSSLIWDTRGASEADLYLVDGRFRVACFLETLLHCKADAVILMHDYAPRLEYHVVEQFARPFLMCETLYAFIRRGDFDTLRATETLARYKTNPG
jgi:hypothetical protein